MRQIIFRGQRKDNNKLVEGNLNVEYDGTCHILQWTSELTDASVNLWEPIEKMYEVYPDTVGMKSDHELSLFEGDIVNYVTGNPKRYVNCVVRFGEYETYTKVIVTKDSNHNTDDGDVEKHFGFYLEDGDTKIPLGSLWIEKIGTIYENPELIKL